jgi:hypothetical protein
MSGMSGYSTMSSLDGGLSRDDRQHSADGAGWGRLSGVNTPGGYHSSRCCSEAQTPHGFDADRAAALREGSAAAAGGAPGERRRCCALPLPLHTASSAVHDSDGVCNNT